MTQSEEKAEILAALNAGIDANGIPEGFNMMRAVVRIKGMPEDIISVRGPSGAEYRVIVVEMS